MSKKEYVEAVIDGIQQAPEGKTIITRLLLSIDRRQSVEDARGDLWFDRWLELSGDPSVDGRKFIPLLEGRKSTGRGGGVSGIPSRSHRAWHIPA
ncbi:hypothetical protein COOONC_18227 [Cooperia oncophora]